jgi:hypothetical protein
MKKATLLTGAFFALTVLFTGAAEAQEELPSRIEVGVQFSSITFAGRHTPNIFSVSSTEAGFGGRITFNINKHFALEGEGNYFPHENYSDSGRGGTLWQSHFGVKVGKRFGKFGVFAKARPGFASFSSSVAQVDSYTVTDSAGNRYTVPIISNKRRTNFALDLGGVLEFYPSRRVLTRIDVGDTLIHYAGDSVVPSTLGFLLEKPTLHNLQISAGIGFRFGSLPPEETTAPTRHEKLQRFEVGAQFSSFGLHQIEHTYLGPRYDYGEVTTQPGFGGRFTFNLMANLALEAQGDFYAQENVFFANSSRAGGRMLQVQAGIKAGKRFEKIGVFGKARPGVISFGSTLELDGFNPTFGFPIFRETRQNYFSMDVGGVLEFYPTRRIVTRFDGGDTMIFYRTGFAMFDFPSPVSFLRVPPETIHNFQFSAGVGFRF